jgi:predicted nucleic acid-binding protein
MPGDRAVPRWAAKRIEAADIEAVLNYLRSIGEHHEIFYLWRPMLRDPKDDLVLELAVAAGAESIITYNQRDFAEAETFGVRVETAKEFLRRIGVLK